MEQELTGKFDILEENQALRIFEHMGPYSVRKFIEALENGQVDGTQYNGSFSTGIWVRDSDYTYMRGPLRGQRVAEEDFVGCLLGWAGFQEQLYYVTIQNEIRERYGKYRPGSDNCTTDEIENFVRLIRPGATPDYSHYARLLKNLAEEFLAGTKQAGPISEEERALYRKEYAWAFDREESDVEA